MCFSQILMRHLHGKIDSGNVRLCQGQDLCDAIERVSIMHLLGKPEGAEWKKSTCLNGADTRRFSMYSPRPALGFGGVNSQMSLAAAGY